MERIEIHTRIMAALLSNDKLTGMSNTDMLNKAEQITDRILLSQAIYEQDNVHFPEDVV
jgi:hypothetical protein